MAPRSREKRAAVAAAALMGMVVVLAVVDMGSLLVSESEVSAPGRPSAAARRMMARPVGGAGAVQPSADGGKGGGAEADLAVSSKNYMVGYGSLMNARSRAKTGDTGSAFPARIKGYRREWSYGQAKRSMTALGARQTDRMDDSLNAVVVTVAASSLPSFDKREKLYRRVEVPHSQITWLGDGKGPALKPTDHVWIYINEASVEPTEPLPIMQSYVDVVLEGCLKYGDEFARECIRTTHLWEDKAGKATVTWVNDRESPKIYERGFVPAPTVAKIDALLRETVPTELRERMPLAKAVKVAPPPVAEKLPTPAAAEQAPRPSTADVVRKDTVVAAQA